MCIMGENNLETPINATFTGIKKTETLFYSGFRLG